MAERVLACRKVSHGLQLQSLWRTRTAAVGSHGRVLACRTAWPTAVVPVENPCCSCMLTHLALARWKEATAEKIARGHAGN